MTNPIRTREELVRAVGLVDKSLTYHRAEIKRQETLKATLLALLETPEQAPAEQPQGPQRPTGARQWVSHVELLPQEDRWRTDGVLYRSSLVMREALMPCPSIWLLQTVSFTEAHLGLGTLKPAHSDNVELVVTCRRSAPGREWYVSNPSEWGPQLEICTDCMRAWMRERAEPETR